MSYNDNNDNININKIENKTVSKPNQVHPLVQLLRYSRKYKSDIIIATLYSILNKLFDIFPEILIGVAVDIVVKRQHSMLAKFGITNVVDQMILLGVITGLIWVCESLFQYLYSLKWSYLAQKIQHDMRLDSYDHVQNLPLEYFEDEETGNVMSIINDDINQLERFLNDGVNQILQIAISTVAIGAVFVYISPIIALLSLIPIPIIIFASFYFRSLMGERYLNMRSKAGEVNTKLNNNLSGIATIKSFIAEKYELSELERLSRNYEYANKRALILSSAIVPVIRMGVMIGFLITLIYGGILTLHGVIAVASYSILIFLSQRLLWPLTYLATVIDTYQRSMASVKRVMGLLETPIAILPGKLEFTNQVVGEIKFKNVSFGYKHRGKLFKKLNFTIPAGKTIAFVGNTGSGKSTIMKLLLRFYELDDGLITIDGVEIKELKFNALRGNIGLVSQDTFLIDGSIAQNIDYGTFTNDDRQIEQAAQIADAHHFITHLPQRYNTLIGERGQKISGGQRQRLAIARAVIKNPPILILDEATAALDNKTELVVQHALKKVSQGRTTIIIAHRLTTIVHADTIHVLNHGEIVESGTHQELLAHGGHYSHLWNLQLIN